MRFFVALGAVVVLLSVARMIGVSNIIQCWQTLPTTARVLYLTGDLTSGLSHHPAIALRTEPPLKIKAASANTRRRSVNRQKRNRPDASFDALSPE
jgi:hypothetical protein